MPYLNLLLRPQTFKAIRDICDERLIWEGSNGLLLKKGTFKSWDEGVTGGWSNVLLLRKGTFKNCDEGVIREWSNCLLLKKGTFKRLSFR